MAMKIQLVVWVVTPHSDVAGYQHFGGPCCLHLHGVLPYLLTYLLTHSLHGTGYYLKS
jgi:hypothetical protein